MLGALTAGQLALLVVCNRVDERRRAATLPVRVELRSDPAQDLYVERWDGARQTVQARSGQYQLLHFWATWCPPCRTELPELLDLAARKRGRLQVWAISTDRDWLSVEKFMTGRKPSGIVRDPTGQAARDYGVTGLPDSYLIDPDGRIRARFNGAQNWSAASMAKILDGLIQDS